MKVYDGNEELSTEHLLAHGVFGTVDRREVPPLAEAVRRYGLSMLDCMTIRDLMDFGGRRGDAPLFAVLAAMFATLRQGGVCLDLDGGGLPDGPAAGGGTGACGDAFLAALEVGRYAKLISGGGEYLPLVLDASRGRRRLYFQKYFFHESRLQSRLERFLAEASPEAPEEHEIDALIDEIYRPAQAIRVGPEGAPIEREPLQAAAIALALKNRFAIVSGGPGTGKTSLMVNILRCLVRRGVPASDIVLGAPTGRAAQRMTETVQRYLGRIQRPTAADLSLRGLKGSTLHKILGYRRRLQGFYHHAGHPLSASVIVVDEVSMVDLTLWDRFLQAVDPGRTRLILLGDRHQLPSVDAGAVLADMIPEDGGAGRFADRLVILEKVYRSGERLLHLAARVNRGKPPDLEPSSFEAALSQGSDRWSFVPAAPFHRWADQLRQWAAFHYLSPPPQGGQSYMDLVAEAEAATTAAERVPETESARFQRLFSVAERSRILGVVRHGAYGAVAVNTVIADFLARRAGSPAPDGQGLFSGALLIVTRNDYAKGLFNGDVGIVLKDAHGGYRAVFQRPGGCDLFPVNLLAHREPAFAMTVHKSQGSEFDDVMLVLPDDPDHRLLSREIVYTGITRAKKRVVIYGSAEVLAAALKRKIRRSSGLAW